MLGGSESPFNKAGLHASSDAVEPNIYASHANGEFWSMPDLMVTKLSSLRRIAISLLFGLLLQACVAEGPDAASKSSVARSQGAAAEIPKGAIPVGQELYQVPIGVDDEGCSMFRMYSPSRLVAQAIYYRDAAGGFTTNKKAAPCASRPPD